MTGTVNSGQGGATITNTVSAASGDQEDPNSNGDDLIESVNVPAANLVTVKSLASGDSSPEEGDVVTFQIEVRNDGPDDATNVSLTDTFPSGITLTANNPSLGTYDAATGLWTIGDLANGDSVTLTLTGTVNSGQGGSMIVNTVTAAAGDQEDPTTVGDDLTETVGVPLANLVTVKTLTSGDSNPNVGDTVTFQIEVRNDGPDDATNVSLTDTFPTGITLTANNPSLGTYDAGTGLWTIGSIANGDSVTLTLTGTVNSGQGGSTITNTVSAASGCLLYTSPSPRDQRGSRMPSSA